MANPFDQFDTQTAPARPAPDVPQPASKQAAPANPFDQFDPAPVTDPGTTTGFADEAPKEASRQLSADDTAEFYRMLRGDGRPRASAKDLRDFVGSKGLALQNADQIVAQRDAGQGVVGQISYPLPKPADPSSATGAAARGASQGATLGFGDELHGLYAGTKAVLSGGRFGDGYASTVDADRGRLAADEEQHPYASLAGEVAGGAVLPLGLEKAGVTASMDAVGLAAYRAAEAEGLSAADARVIAQRAVARRLTGEGAAYGAAYGAGTADGGPGQRLLGAGEGALAGATLPLASHLLAPVTAPLRNRVASTADAVYNAGRRLVSPFTREGAQDRAADVLRTAASRSPDDIAADIAAAPEAVDGVRPTLAEVAGDPGLAGLQRGHANTDPNTAAAVGERNASNALARTQAASGTLGDGSPQAMQDFAAGQMADAERATATQQAARQAGVDTRITEARQTADAGHATATQALSDAVHKLGPTADREATGAAARDAFDTAYEAAKGRTREAYAAPALNTVSPMKLPRSLFMKVRQAADDFYGDGGGEMPSRMQGILSDMADENATTRTLTNIDRRLADFAGEAQMQGRRSEAAFANRVRGSLDEFTQTAAPQSYRDALTNAKAIRAEQGRIFETGDAASAFSRDRFGNASVGDTTVPTRLVRPGAAGGDTADQLIQSIGPEHAENIVRQEIRRVADEKGVQTGAQARALATRFGDAARRFPAVRNDLQALQAQASSLDAARGTQSSADALRATREELASTSELSALHKALLASPVAKLADPTVDPASYVKGLMRRSDGGLQLKRLGASLQSKPEAVSGLRRALGDYIIDAGKGPNFTAAGDQVPAINKTRQAISEVVKRAGPVLSDQQKIVLQRVQRELEQANFAVTASKPTASDTAMNQTYKGLLRYIPMVPDAAKTILSHVLSAMGKGEEVKNLITEAILNPDFAATLLKRPTERHWAQVQDGLIGRKAVAGSAIVGQPANDRYGVHDILLTAMGRGPGQAATPQSGQQPDQQASR